VPAAAFAVAARSCRRASQSGVPLMASQEDHGLTGYQGDANEAIRQLFGESVHCNWSNRAALVGTTQWRAMADVILAADYLKQESVLQEFFDALLSACGADEDFDNDDGVDARTVRAVLVMISRLGTSYRGVRNALSHQLALRSSSAPGDPFSSVQSALLFMAMAVGAEAVPVAEQVVRHAIRTICTKNPDTPPEDRMISALTALTGRSCTNELLPPTLRDKLNELVGRLTFNIPFDLFEEGVGTKRDETEGGGVVIHASFRDALDAGGASATALVNFLIEFVDVKLTFTSKTFGSAAETKGCDDPRCCDPRAALLVHDDDPREQLSSELGFVNFAGSWMRSATSPIEARRWSCT